MRYLPGGMYGFFGESSSSGAGPATGNQKQPAPVVVAGCLTPTIRKGRPNLATVMRDGGG